MAIGRRLFLASVASLAVASAAKAATVLDFGGEIERGGPVVVKRLVQKLTVISIDNSFKSVVTPLIGLYAEGWVSPGDFMAAVDPVDIWTVASGATPDLRGQQADEPMALRNALMASVQHVYISGDEEGRVGMAKVSLLPEPGSRPVTYLDANAWSEAL